MPDLLAHYLVSYLTARTIVKPRYALIIAFVGLLPDVDALLGVHRWVTHSVLVALLASTPLLALAYLSGGRYVRVVLLSLLLYTLHIVLDVFTGPTPILYPLTDSLWIEVEVNGSSTTTGITITPRITLETVKPDFTRQSVIEGPVVSETGIILAIVTLLTLILDQYRGKEEVQTINRIHKHYEYVPIIHICTESKNTKGSKDITRLLMESDARGGSKSDNTRDTQGD